MKKEEKHKAVAIPVSFKTGKPRFLVVRDKRHKDWTFITGGCRKREIFNPIRCALRELEEETRGIVNLTDVKYNYFRFTTKSLSHDEVRKERENGVDLTLVYHVYVIETELDRVDERNIISNFNIEKEKMDERRKNKQPIKRTYDENDFMAFDTLDEFKRRKVWSLIRENVINNPDFQVALTSKNRESFYLKNH